MAEYEVVYTVTTVKTYVVEVRGANEEVVEAMIEKRLTAIDKAGKQAWVGCVEDEEIEYEVTQVNDIS